MAQRDAAGVNGSSRIMLHGAPPGRVMPNGCLGSPVLVLPPALTKASSWMSDLCALCQWACVRRSRGSERASGHVRDRPLEVTISQLDGHGPFALPPVPLKRPKE